MDVKLYIVTLLSITILPLILMKILFSSKAKEAKEVDSILIDTVVDYKKYKISGICFVSLLLLSLSLYAQEYQVHFIIITLLFFLSRKGFTR